jgi:hypothetical protein
MKLPAWARAYLESVPLSSIAEVPEGIAAVEGRARARQLVHSPVSGIPCIGFHVLIEVDDVDVIGRTSSLDVVRINPFDVVDPTGRAEVDTSHCTPIWGFEYKQSSDRAGSLVAPVIRLLSPEEKKWLNRFERFTWSEFYLEPDEPVYVCGRVQHSVDPDARAIHYRENAYRPSIHPMEDGTLIIADLPRDQLLG